MGGETKYNTLPYLRIGVLSVRRDDNEMKCNAVPQSGIYEAIKALTLHFSNSTHNVQGQIRYQVEQ